MKILFLATSFYSQKKVSGGMEKYLLNICMSLQKKHQICLLIPSDYNVSLSNIHVYNYYKSPNPLLSGLLSSLSILINFVRIAIREKPQVISNFMSNPATAFIYPLAKIFRIKTVLNFRGYPETASIQTLLIKIFYNLTYFSTDVIICNAKDLIQKYQNAIFFGRSRYMGIKKYYLPNAIDSNFWHPSNQVNDVYDLSFVGNISNKMRIRLKGFRYLSEALQLINERYGRKLKCVVVGDFNISAIRKEIPNFDASFFEFKGSISKKEDVRSIVEKGRIFVLSSISEGMPNVLMENMSLGKPCISTDVGATNVLIENNKSGFLVPRMNSQELATKIWLLYNNLDLQQKFSDEARKKMIQKFSWNRILMMVEKVYQQIIDR